MKNLNSTKAIQMEGDEELNKMFESYNKNIIAIFIFSAVQFVFLVSIL